MLNWVKHFKSGEKIYGHKDVSWSRTQLYDMTGVTIYMDGIEHEFHYGPGDYHYEEDWEVTVGQNNHQLLCKRVIFYPYNAIAKPIVREFYTHGTTVPR